MSRAGGLLGAVAVVVLATIVAGAATAAKKPQPPETSRRCRAVLGRDVLNVTSVGLRNMASCQRHADAGRPPRSDCNGLETTATTAYGRAEELLRRHAGDAGICPPGDPALANYPGGTSQGLITALLPAVDNFETRIRWMPVNRCNGTQTNVFFSVFQITAKFDDLGRIRNVRSLAQSVDGFEDGGVRHFDTSFFVTDQSSAPFFQM